MSVNGETAKESCLRLVLDIQQAAHDTQDQFGNMSEAVANTFVTRLRRIENNIDELCCELEEAISDEYEANNL